MGHIKDVRKIAFLGLMLAMMMVVTIFEQMLPPLPLLPPNVKLGLSNVITMYCFFFVGKQHAVTLLVLKSCFVFLTRGWQAFALSLTGGMLSILIIAGLVFLFRSKISYTVISIAGAIFHNIGQLIAVSFIFRNNFVFYYLPILLLSGILMGSITGTLLKVVMPVFKNIIKM